MSKAHIGSEKRMSQLPGWLWPNSNVLSPLYKRIWEAVQEDRTRSGAMSGEVLVDTNKIFPLLLTSQLPTEVLGYIWSLANQKYAGQLTEQELYIVLALVALAQASYPFNSLEVLYYIRIPPTPNLNLSLLDTITTKNETKVHSSQFESLPTNSVVANKKHGNSSRPTNKVVNLSSNNEGLTYNHNHSDLREVKFSSGHSPSYSNSNAVYVDARQNFYSQPDVKHQTSFSSNDNDDFSDFQSAPITNVPSIPNIWDSKQGSAIGSRLANHNLGVKKLSEKIKKTGTNKSSSNSQIRNLTASNLPSHIPRDAAPNERLSELFPKCTVKNQAKTVILKDTAIRNNDPVEVVKPAPKDFSNNIEKVVINKINPLPKPTYTKSVEPVYATIIKESRDDGLQQDLMSLQPTTEDKYSALRGLVEEPSVLHSKINPEPVNVSPPADDFGDFVSAEQPEHTPASTTVSTPIPMSENLSTVNSIDLLSDFDFNTDNIIGTNNKSSPSLIQEISEAFNALNFEDTLERQTEEKFDVVFDTDKVLDKVQKEDSVSVNSIELGPAVTGVLTRSGSVPSLDLKSFLPSSQEDEQHVENMHQMIYWEWKQYMESCVLLLQVAANIFTSITSEIVLREVLQSAQGYNFLVNLAEVAAVCRRVNFSHKEMDINIMGFDDLLMDIDRIWSEMEPFYANIPIVTELPAWPLHQGDGITCSLCLTIITSGRVIYNDNNYHATCANLWLHTVNNNLPALRYPIIYLQSIIPQSTFDQFEFDGCENCDEFLRMKNNKDNVFDCTSSNFDGMIAAMSPEDSWVCKWQRINRFTKGVYAISVSGRLPAGVIREMKSRGIVYRSRDTSQR